MTTSIYEQKIVKKRGITFDDVLLIPGESVCSRKDISLKTQLTRSISLDIPLVSSPMDTVTGSALAIALATMGGIGVIHRNLSIADQVKEVRTVRHESLLVGAAIGVSSGFEERAKKLIEADVSVLLIDSAHGFSAPVLSALKTLKNKYPTMPVIAGNIATADAAEALIANGADALRVGMGPGAICTTRIISGMGVPQITAILDVVSVAKHANIPVIADGGITYSGDMVKALAAGASTIMMGSVFAACEESPGALHTLKAHEVPARFRNILKPHKQSYQFKSYRGMGSVGAMKQGARVKSEDEYHGKSYNDRVLVAEGVEGMVPVKGTVQDVVNQALGGIQSGMYYVGAQNITELWNKSRFMRITPSSLKESHPHDLFVTNPGNNYS